MKIELEREEGDNGMKPITSISAGQQEQCVNVIKDAARKAGEATIAELATNGIINSGNFQRVLEWGNKLVPAIQTFVKEQIVALAKDITGIVRLISGAETLELDETDGKATIAKAKETFSGYIDGDFKEWGCDVKSESTGKTQVTVHKMVKDGTFAQIFGGMSDDLNGFCLTQPQIIQSVEKHRKWLRTDGYGTFFLFKVGEDFFVANVNFDDGGRLEVFLHRFSGDYVWYAGYAHRIVVPQLALKS